MLERNFGIIIGDFTIDQITQLEVFSCIPKVLLVDPLTDCSRGKSRDEKKMQDKTEGAMKISPSRAAKQAPT